jgi:hypothetical protein
MAKNKLITIDSPFISPKSLHAVVLCSVSLDGMHEEQVLPACGWGGEKWSFRYLRDEVILFERDE